MTVRVLVADDQAMVRSGFSMILDAQDDLVVVGEAADGVEALELAARLHPDVVLMDVRMPRLDGLEALRQLTRRERAPKVVVVTTFADDEYLDRALRHGAYGFLTKDAGPTLLVEAVRAAASGEAMVSPSMTMRLLRRLRGVPGTGTPATPGTGEVAAPGHEALSARELDVVRLVATGRTNLEIATDLHIAVGTVKTHLGNVQDKLLARNRVEIAAWAWRTGLVT